MKTEKEQIPRIYVNTKELAAALSVGESTAEKIGKRAGAFVMLEGCKRFNFKKVLAYIEQNEGTGKEYEA